MIWFFRTSDYRFRTGLFVQSGTVEVLRRCQPRLREVFGDCAMDLLTCYPQGTAEFQAFRRVWDVREFAGTREKLRLLTGLRKKYDLLVVLASNETVMRRWRLVSLLLLAPRKAFAFNENGDGYWLDWPHRRLLWHHMVWRMDRAGLSVMRLVAGSLARVVLAPLVYLYLFSFLAATYARRGVRQWLGQTQAKPRTS